MDQCHRRMYIRDHRTSAITWCLKTELKLRFSKAYFGHVNSSSINPLDKLYLSFSDFQSKDRLHVLQRKWRASKAKQKDKKSISLFE